MERISGEAAIQRETFFQGRGWPFLPFIKEYKSRMNYWNGIVTNRKKEWIILLLKYHDFPLLPNPTYFFFLLKIPE